MSKEKQIEEMAQFMAVISRLECGKKTCEECKWCGCERIGKADCMDYLIAEHLYNAGYRKQSEGEWKVCGAFDDFLKCSCCGYDHPWQTAIEHKFCPNCGAKMKGGEE